MKNQNLYNKCTLCPRNCGADRNHKQTGVCGVTSQLRVARAALHYWEEPCISGTNGSGAVFFSGCALHCVFCQNEPIAQGSAGIDISPQRLAEIFLELQEQKANNINLVTPGQYVPHIIEAVESARRQGLRIPIVYNTGSYEKVDTLKMLEGIVDIYLPDFKYMSRQLAKAYSKTEDYPKIAQSCHCRDGKAATETAFSVGKPNKRRKSTRGSGRRCHYDKRCDRKTAFAAWKFIGCKKDYFLFA